ncbi:invasion associated locus B family protein [Nitrogeniibacter aestuarii]|uniref:invasion associated locus B family protein n=1 Tax=Nitrogeniibacter aestuarii TaxID=2815343 RepID=UPI001D120E5E|nr:invasion associated locus B family protein [Nitrogeniibacter aestuarii]
MVSNRSFIARASLVAGIAAATLFTSGAFAAKSGDTFDDWKIECEKQEGAPAELCHAFQLVTMKDSDKRVLHVAIGYPPDQPDPIAIFTTPLGVALQAGVQIKIDDKEPKGIAFNVCNNNGCQAAVKLDAASLEELKMGNAMTVTFGNLKRQGLNVPVSLKGLTAALKSVEK